MNIKLLCPSEKYILHEKYITAAKQNCKSNNMSLEITHDIDYGYAKADIVYAKSWGSLSFYGNPEEEKVVRDNYKHFIVDGHKMSKTNNALFSHCLPLRRNIKATDEVMDANYCVAI